MSSTPFICGRCSRAMRLASLSRAVGLPPTQRQLSHSARLALSATKASSTAPEPQPTANQDDSPESTSKVSEPPDREPGAMSRRLQEATEEALLTGGRAGQRAVEDAGFSEELKQRLLDKIAHAKFQSENSAALAQASVTSKLPGSAGEGTRAMASGQVWTGEETTEDAVLRMLNDARKPLAPGLRGKQKIPDPIVDMRIRREPTRSAGHRAASARDKASVYAGMGLKDATGLSEKEREDMKREFRERFTPDARAMPNTITGLAALANERIENAIARGQFKNIPRGKGVERDTRADNPFIDTTEYIMNKMIKRQEIVPPWIEKQQELLKTARTFRARLRNDWKRHAARMISAQGGSLQQKMDRANAYAAAEEVHNPRKRNVDSISVPTNSTDDVVMVKMRQQALAAAESDSPSSPEATPTTEESRPVITRPFRDPTWEAAERSYMELAINNLNAITRSYNLMAPELAKKPYFSLERELNNCYADCAPEVAEEIKIRAAGPTKPLDPFGGPGTRSTGIMGSFGANKAKVYDDRKPKYGFKEFWRDLWKKDGEK
ncbi:hypothetical protein QBC35DRAFT_75810 [Podospora australis]|uniref:DnaJ homologue subfamily C member 28 conserved domain-containing protein n=1 Tax=Podospora australis TaxID=1536484 RepID=A0AAN6WMF7_9PEZI|nr:hypothetical protein QBC35DRAFT_75810 [Podospora australis]